MKIYDVQKLAEELRITEITIRKYIKSGSLKASKIGRKLYVLESDLINFIKQSPYRPMRKKKR